MDIPQMAEVKVRKAPQISMVREEEVKTLRKLLTQKEQEIASLKAMLESLKESLFTCREEAFEYYQQVKRLSSYLNRLADAVLAGEMDEAQTIAHKAQTLLKEVNHEQ